jgi:hypothetical protein
LTIQQEDRGGIVPVSDNLKHGFCSKSDSAVKQGFQRTAQLIVFYYFLLPSLFDYTVNNTVKHQTATQKGGFFVA